jgi:hypothetical protein
MQERVAQLESSVASLQAEMAALRARLAAIESGTPLPVGSGDALDGIPEVNAAQVEGWLAVIGRTLVILGGAYLLRAITSAQVVSYTAGVAAGLVYGAPWLVLAARAGARGRFLDAFFYGLATALIGYPLVWEATIRFGVLTPGESALVVGGLTAAAFGLSAAWRLHSLAAIVTCGALASAIGLPIATGAWLPYTALALAVGLATLWLGYLRDWVLLRWPAALAADLMIVVLTGRPDGRFWPVLVVQLVLIGGYFGSFAARTLRKGRVVIPFEIAQSAGILGVVVPCLLIFVAPMPAGVWTAGVTILITGAAAYAVTLTMVRRQAPLANLFFYSLFALALTVIGGAITAPRLAPIVLGAAAVAAAVAARRTAPLVLWTQTVLLLVAAAVASGVLSSAAAALAAPAAAWDAPGLSGWIVVVCAAAALTVKPVREDGFSYGLAAVRLALSAVTLWLTAGAAVYAVASLLQRLPGWDASWLATLRTGIAVAATLGVAYASRDRGWREAGWLTYPLLVLVGMKLLLSDFPSGRPLTLFLALAAYGLALIAAPRAQRGRFAAP